MAAMGVRRLLRPARARVHRLAAARLTDWAAKGRQWAAGGATVHPAEQPVRLRQVVVSVCLKLLPVDSECHSSLIQLILYRLECLAHKVVVVARTQVD